MAATVKRGRAAVKLQGSIVTMADECIVSGEVKAKGF
jgi:hypothetical protein